MADEKQATQDKPADQDKPAIQDTGDATGEKGGTTPSPFISFASEAEFQTAIDERLKKRLEREQRKAEELAQKARDEAEAKALADQQEWQKLAEKHGKSAETLKAELDTRLADLEAVNQRIERAEEALAGYLKAEKEGLPESVLELLEKLDPVDQLAYLTKHRDALTSKADGVPPSPKPADLDQAGQQERGQRKQRMAKQVRQWM
jgi:MFS superfamily sulfate permease-like transporter